MARKISVPEEKRSKQLRYYHSANKGKKLGARPTMRRKHELENLSPFHKHLMSRVYHKKNVAKSKGIPFDLDLEWALQQVPFCSVTGGPLTIDRDWGPMAVSLDQIIPSAGYTKANTRIVAVWFNLGKKNWPDEEVQKIIIDAAAHMSAVKE